MQTELIQIGGAGPAGLAAAITLARAGRRVRVHEVQPEVGHRFNGDFQGLENWSTRGDALDLLREQGITTEFTALPFSRGQAFDAWGEHYEIAGAQTLFYMVERGPGVGTLDRAMLEQARALGVEVCFNSRIDHMVGPGILAAGPKATDAIGVGYHFESTLRDGFWLILEGENDSVNRYKVSKQADVLMLFYLISAEELGALFERLDYPFEYETIPRNVAYYAGRMTHGSTLCRVVTAWVLARSDRPRSMQIFTQALQSDVADIQQGTTAEGIHLGAMAGTVDLVQRVWTGIEVRDDVLRLHPELPPDVERLDMRLRYRGHSIDLRLEHDTLTVRTHESAMAPFPLCVDGKSCQCAGGMTHVFRLNEGGNESTNCRQPTGNCDPEVS